tara:strand:+ start:1311 stop:1733 length:423 start_codon:yes stop_codon:yes gene_type:complete
MSEINTSDTCNCPTFPTLEELAKTRFDKMFPKYDMLVPTTQQEFNFPEPYNPQSQGIMPISDTLTPQTPYELLKAENVDQSRIQLAQNVNEVILQNLQTENNIVQSQRRRYRTRGDMNRKDYENISNIITTRNNDNFMNN